MTRGDEVLWYDRCKDELQKNERWSEWRKMIRYYLAINMGATLSILVSY